MGAAGRSYCCGRFVIGFLLVFGLVKRIALFPTGRDIKMVKSLDDGELRVTVGEAAYLVMMMYIYFND